MEKQVIKDALWVDVGDYTVLRNGSILKRNWNKTGKTREVKQSVGGNGYLHFYHNGKTVLSHRIIAEVYISNPDNLPEINHKSEKFSTPEDNNPLNLEWCDHSYNINFGTHNERVAKANTNGKRSKKVCQYALDGSFIREWPSTIEVERQLGYYHGSISKCCLGKYKQAYNYIWKYAE